MDKVTTALVQALKQALTEPGERRLFRSGKLPGLFGSRTGANAEAAEIAVRDGLLEIVRTEQKGKSRMDWVRATPKAVDFVHEHQSPAAALHELQHILQTTKMSLPLWIADIHEKLQTFTADMTREIQTIAHRLDALSQRVEEAIVRAETDQPRLSLELRDQIPWAGHALNYLDRRLENGLEMPCPLSELFAALREDFAELTVADYHAGLRRLFDRGMVRLLPYDGSNGLPEPEYALLDGVFTYYYVARAGNIRTSSSSRAA